MTDNKILEQKKADAERLAQLFRTITETDMGALKCVAVGMMLNAQIAAEKAAGNMKAAG